MKLKLLFILIVSSSAICFSQEKIKNAKESLKKNESSSSGSSKVTTRTTTSSSSSYDDNNNLYFDSFWEELAFNVFLGVGIGRAEYTEINPYPYYADGYGEYTRDFDGNTKRTNFKIGANFLIDRIKGIELNAVFKPIPIAGLEVSHLNFSEKGLLGSESLNITSINANYYRFREKYFSLWWGAGATYVGNEVDTWGFSYNIGTEIYPVKPLSFLFSWKQSFINDSEVDVFKAQTKYHLKRTALYTGYHDFNLGSENVSGIVFGIEYTF
ncbi:hypothetical protein [Tenacibaculum sp. M341]|uniref:hypothetical protein n=1 Tax=Tenacibaculum sp. M341 TaxID=2530339 RepID=UPI0010539E82|nr:hypothetical protein [Tenacibaculum sp. M341]TCI85838.1 hypothetical protein EYW44_15430 [Tenacibaculum sp. M341]